MLRTLHHANTSPVLLHFDISKHSRGFLRNIHLNLNEYDGTRKLWDFSHTKHREQLQVGNFFGAGEMYQYSASWYAHCECKTRK